MGEIIEYRHPGGPTHDLEAAFHAGETFEREPNPLRVDTDVGGNSHCGKRISDVVRPEQRHLELAENLATTPDFERRRAINRFDVVRLPVSIVGRAKGLKSRFDV